MQEPRLLESGKGRSRIRLLVEGSSTDLSISTPRPGELSLLGRPQPRDSCQRWDAALQVKLELQKHRYCEEIVLRGRRRAAHCLLSGSSEPCQECST